MRLNRVKRLLGEGKPAIGTRLGLASRWKTIKGLTDMALGLFLLTALPWGSETALATDRHAEPKHQLNVVLSCQGRAPLHGIADLRVDAEEVSLACDEEERLITGTVILGHQPSQRWWVRLTLTTPDDGRTCEDSGARLPMVARCDLLDETLSFGISTWQVAE